GGRAAEQRVRRGLGAERAVADDAGGLPRPPAGRDRRERAAGVLALCCRDLATEQQGRHQLPSYGGVAVDLVRDHLGQRERALRVADEDDAAPVVLVREVV